MVNAKRLTMLLMAAVILFLPTNNYLYAASREYDVSGYNINVNILPDGSADVEERIAYRFKGNFNGVFLDVDFSGSNGLSGHRVTVQKTGGMKEFAENSTGSSGTYTYAIEGNTAKFKVYEQSSDETKVLVYKYKLLDVVTRYNDVAEFNRKMVGRNWQVPVNNVKINILLPEGALKDEVRVFAHGPLTGECRLADAGLSEFSVPLVNPGFFFETRVLFPTNLVPLSRNMIDKNALQAILEKETKWAEEANAEREKARKEVEKERVLTCIGKLLTILLFAAWIAVMIYIRKKYGTDPKTEFQGKYYREIPGDYTPAELNFLFAHANPDVTAKDILATLLDLVRKRVLLLSTEKSITSKLLLRKENTEYIFAKNPHTPVVQLKPHEEFLILWFFDIIGKGERFSLSDIKISLEDRGSIDDFKQNYSKWKDFVKEEAIKNKFYPSKERSGLGFGFLTGIGFIAAGISVGFGTHYTIAGIIGFFGIVMICFSSLQIKRTKYGSDQYKKWRAFKNFIRDFSRIKDAKIPSIVVWEHYLVYAIPLGLAKEVMTQLPLILDRKSSEMIAGATIPMGILKPNQHVDNFKSFNDAFNDMSSSISDAFSVAYSSDSSSSGSGGGASGGDSGGGGGDSGGGAF